jgi:hypothetical protein
MVTNASIVEKQKHNVVYKEDFMKLMKSGTGEIKITNLDEFKDKIQKAKQAVEELEKFEFKFEMH